MRHQPVCLCLSLIVLGCAAAPDANLGRVEEPLAEARDVEVPEGDGEVMERLARTDPVAFLRKAIDRYDREVRSYRCILEKQERVQGRLLPAEVVECCFREEPFSVRMDWSKGARLAKRTAYVKGANNGNVLVLGAAWREWIGVVERAPDGGDAKASSRFPVTEFGLRIGARRALAAWSAAKERGDLKVEFNGVKEMKVLSDRPVWEMKRVGYPKPEDDGITQATLYFDIENWQLIGSIMTGEEGQLIGSYFFRDVELNPEFAADTFTRAGLTK